MSGEYSFAAQTNDFPVKDRAGSSKKIEKGLKRLLILAGIVIGAQFIWLFVISPCIPFSTVEIRGFSGFDSTDVLVFAGIPEGASFVSVNTADAQRRLSSHYLVESARVIKRFPDRLSIFLQPRKAAALSLVNIRGRPVPLYFDRHGVVFQIGGADPDGQMHLPVISGLVFENPFLGMRLPPAFLPLLEDISKIYSDSPQLLAAVSEIRINRKHQDDFDLVLYPVHSSIRIRLENKLSEDTLRYVLLMLDVFESRSPKPREIDFRSGMASYKIKEATSGE
jgi:cell division protein FtsQ